jgi:murE/murF fusion protein|tara:strand:+ start:2281 stop:5043 length:2763 start_codon:yes stop_codon:yes gene_type:complete
MLLEKIINISRQNIKNINIKNLTLDSRKVKKGDLFFAIKGKESNGEDYIDSAIKKGAAAVICEADYKKKNKKINVIKVDNIKKILDQACKNFFKDKPKNIIAVTGTNGKSSVADFFYQLLYLNKIPVASIGTLGVKFNNRIKKNNLTSPDIISLHLELSNLKKKGVQNVIIEASSHGLHQGRVSGLRFKAGIFTNFSQDHLDYHKTMKNYLKAKLTLFSKYINKNSFAIADKDEKKFTQIKKITNKKKIKLITIQNFFLNIGDKTKLIGSFQLKNLKMSSCAAKLCGLSEKKINNTIHLIKPVDGRMELIKEFSNKSKVFIDYAHTPEALYTSIISLKKHFNSDVTLVFGCGGNRDIKKRSLMAKVAKALSNKIFVTDDNPRNENPKNIRKEIIKYLNNSNYQEIGSRESAIKKAIKDSKNYEIILIAGKGHENEQDYGNKILNISDKKIIKKCKLIKKKFNFKDYNYQKNSEILNTILKNKKNYNFQGVSINSKQIKKNNLFISIKGKKYDGHNYIKEALKKSASYCVVSKKAKGINKKKIIKVSNTENFLNEFSYKKRNKSKAKIIAITGSTGKTTLKTLLGDILNKYAKTYYSPRSFNNHYGVPLSLSNLDSEYNYGVFEVGMSRKGEIRRLSKLIKPDIAIITNIAEAHIENFKNLKEIAMAKGEIIDNIKEKGTILINRDDKFFNYLNKRAKNSKIKVISFGNSKKSDVHPVSSKKNIVKIKVINEFIYIKSVNTNILNILASLALIKTLNLSIKKSTKSIERFSSLEGRGKTHIVKRFNKVFKLIDESYNANPLSVKNAIVNLSNIKKINSKKYLLLGDMLELGSKSKFYHKNLSKIINNTDIDKVFVCGKKALNTFQYTKKNKQGNILHNKDEFDEVFSDIIKKDDILMIKGSNATGLGEICKKIISGELNAI